MQGRKAQASPAFFASEPKGKGGFVLRKDHGTKVPAAPAAAVRVRKKIDWRKMMIQDVTCGWGDRQIRFARKVAEEMPVITSSQVSAGSAWLKARRGRES
jgi:hypothetical protein